GSQFSVIIPIEFNRASNSEEMAVTKGNSLIVNHSKKQSQYLNVPAIDDDRNTIVDNDKIVLIIEDDLKFATILLKQTNQKGFKCLSAATGADGLILAEKYKPDAIILDLKLPGMNGENVLLELKSNPALRHIPVHIISVNERSLDLIKNGAIEYLVK